jgi:hypothetical protein
MEGEQYGYEKVFRGNKGGGDHRHCGRSGKGGYGRVRETLFMEDGTIAFIMADRLTHHNLQSNDHAAYLFMEEGSKSKGKRLFLTKIREEKDTDLLYSLRSKKYSSKKEEGKDRFLVFFKIDEVLPMIGPGEEG